MKPTKELRQSLEIAIAAHQEEVRQRVLADQAAEEARIREEARKQVEIQI